MNHSVGAIFRKNGADCICIADILLFEMVPTIRSNCLERSQITCVSQFINDYDFVSEFQYEVTAHG